VATDLDTTVLRDLSRPNLAVRMHDVLVDDVPEDDYERLTIDQLRDAMVASGVASAQDVRIALALCDDPELAVLSQLTMAAWGRRP
jgi:hypothetical protein